MKLTIEPKDFAHAMLRASAIREESFWSNNGMEGSAYRQELDNCGYRKDWPTSIAEALTELKISPHWFKPLLALINHDTDTFGGDIHEWAERTIGL